MTQQCPQGECFDKNVGTCVPIEPLPFHAVTGADGERWMWDPALGAWVRTRKISAGEALGAGGVVAYDVRRIL